MEIYEDFLKNQLSLIEWNKGFQSAIDTIFPRILSMIDYNHRHWMPIGDLRKDIRELKDICEDVCKE